MSYASGTTVSVEKSKAEIEALVSRFGAEQFFSGWKNGSAVVGFRCRGRMVRFDLALPAKDAREFVWTGKYMTRRRHADDAYRAWEQACRERWRALVLVVKAKLAAVEAGVATFEQEFLAYVMLPQGQTVGEWIAPQLEATYASGAMPAELPGLPQLPPPREE